jgi:hypothetical protein
MISFMYQSQGHLTAYADDIIWLYKGKDWESVIKTAERDMYLLHQWLNSQHMFLNLTKTKVIGFSCDTRRSLPQNVTIKVHDGPDCFNSLATCSQCPVLSTVSSVKYLGVHIDDSLKWNAHVNYIRKKLRKTSFVMYELRNVLGYDYKKALYMALVQSHLLYGIRAWGSARNNVLTPLHVAQKRLIKILYNFPRRFPSRELFRMTGLTNLRTLYCTEVTAKTLSHTPAYMALLTNLNKRVMNIPLPAVHSEIGKTTCNFKAVTYFNTFPPSIKKEIAAIFRQHLSILKIAKKIKQIVLQYENSKI